MRIVPAPPGWLRTLTRHAWSDYVTARQKAGRGAGNSEAETSLCTLEARDELGNVTGTFGGDDLDFAVAYGHDLVAGLRAGVSAHLVRERLAELATGTYAFGAGATWVRLREFAVRGLQGRFPG